MFIGRFGPDGQTLGSFELTASNSDDLPRMMNEGVQRMDELFTQALAAGIVRGDPDLIIQPPPPPEEEEEDSPTDALIQPTVVQVLVIERGDADARGAIGRPDSRPCRGDLGHPGARCPTAAPICRSTSAATSHALGSALASRGWAVDQSRRRALCHARRRTRRRAAAAGQSP